MKKLFFRIFKILLGLLIILFIGGYFFINTLKPTYEGEVSIKGLSAETTIYFDDYGVPHIYAENEEDAMQSLGYLHAQDRLWQMELMRRIAPGKLSEIFGEVALENDKLYIGLGIEEATAQTLKNIDKNSVEIKLAQAYLDGINQFIENGPTPIEFYILGIDKQKFELKDTYNIFGYMAFSFAMAHKTDPLISSILAKYGEKYVKELGIDIDPNSLLIKNYNPLNETIANTVANILNSSPIPAFIGSNSWIVGSEKAKNGKVLFANDPHMSYASPAVWYEAHIKTPDFESYGYYLGGIPFPLLSHNREYAYGLTMFENDDIDFYQEENHPSDDTLYKTSNGYKSYTTIQKTIKIKDADDLVLEIKSTQHGPIINDFITTVESAEPMAVSWIFTKMHNQGLSALYQISRAKNKSEFEQGVSLIHAPGLNIMYGDAKDNISWWAAAQLYKLPKNVNPKLVLDGTSGTNEIVEYLGFNQNPQAHNPPWNYVYSANNQPDSIAGILYPGYYLPEDRAKRIVELIEPKNDWTKEDYMRMFTDSKSAVVPSITKIISNHVNGQLTTENEKEALKIIANWDGDFITSSVGATIYTKFLYTFLYNTFEDEIGETSFENFLDTHLMKRLIAEQLKKEESVWWDNINTPEIENKTQILVQSFSEAVTSLEKQLGNDVTSWTWGRVHTLNHNHALGSVKILDYLFNLNVGTFEMDGTNEVINNQHLKINSTGIYDVYGGPSTRRIVDFSDVENSMSILPTGNSGNPFSKFYRDQAEMFVNGEFRKMKLNKEEIERVSTKLMFSSK